jgi:hypothetical protein
MVARPAWAYDEHQRCDGCGFDPRDVRDRELPASVRALGDRWVVFIDSFEHRHHHGDELLHGHPHAGLPSAQEYGRHLRDRLLALTPLVEEALATGRAPAHWRDEPDAEAWPGADGDDPDVLVGQITAATDRLAEVLGGGPATTADPAAAGRIARFALHEGYHHLAVAERAVADQLAEP